MGSVIAENAQHKFQHDIIPVETKRGKIMRQHLIEQNQKSEEAAANQTAVSVADMECQIKKQIKKDFAVHSPADAHQGLQNSAADIEGNE